MVRQIIFSMAVMLGFVSLYPASAQNVQPTDPLQYADFADLSVDAPTIAHITVKEAIKVKPERAPNAPAGTQRFYVVGIVKALIRGQSGLPGTIRYIIDVPLDTRGRAPKMKKREYLVFARANGGPDIQLVAPDAQIEWTAQRDLAVRSIVRELVSADAAPKISRIASAFHVPGTILGEGETQIFIETETNAPVSITVLSRAGQEKIWAVSLSEIVDEAATAPRRNTLTWYRLACFLPRELPYEALSGISENNARSAREDYAMVRGELGSCPRGRR